MPDPVKDLGCEVMFSRTDGYGFYRKPAYALTSFGVAAFATIRLAQPKQAQPAKAGGARRDRTDDLMLAKHALSQLSYGPVFKQQRPSSPFGLCWARFAFHVAWLCHA